MSITLYISSSKCKDLSIDNLLCKLQVECQIYKTMNSLQKGKKFIKEYGFCIKTLNVSNDDFKIKVWFPLKKSLELECAFVKKEDEYMGCILNWPNVFRQTVCSKL